MADDRQGGLVVTFDDDNTSRDTIKSYRVQSSYMTATDAFEFTLWDENLARLRGLELRPVTLSIDDRPILRGRIERTQRKGPGTEIVCMGRDYVSELVECHCDPGLKLKAGMTVIDAIALAVASCGVTTVLGETELALRNIRTGRNIAVQKAPPEGFRTAKLEDYKPQPSEGIYQFCARLLARFGATLQPSDRREAVVLSAPQYRQNPVAELRRFVDPTSAHSNNVLDSEADRDYTHFPTYSMFRGGAAGTDSNIKVNYDMATLADAFSGELKKILGEAVIPGRVLPTNAAAFGLAQLYRLHFTHDTESKTKAQLERVAKRQIAEHLKDTLRYSATLAGHTDPESGATLAVDTLVSVNDEVRDVREPLWVESVDYSYDEKNGPQSQLECWRPDSFQIGE